MAEKEKEEVVEEGRILKSIRHEYLGFCKLGAVTVRERPLPKSYGLKCFSVQCDKKQFYMNSSKGSDVAEDNAKTRQMLRREKIKKPIITTGESDAKIRMPPPKYPPPRFIKKKKGSSKSGGAKLRPTLQPVEGSHSSSKNRLNFVPFELPKGRARTQSPTFPNNTAPGSEAEKGPGSSKSHGKGGKAAKLAAIKRKRQKIVKKLRPISKAGETPTVIPGNQMRKLVNSWATKLGSFSKNECIKKKIKQKKTNPALKSTLPHPTKAQLKQADSSKTTVQKIGFSLINRYRMGRFKSWRCAYHSQNPAEETDSSTADQSSSTPVKVTIRSNPLVNNTVDLLRYKRDLEACSDNLDPDILYKKIASFPVIPTNIPKGELLLESIPMSMDEVKNVLMKRVAILLAHGGFTHTKLPAMEMLADSLNNFLINITRRLKQIKERELSGVDHGFPDPVERVLVELGMGGVRGLEEFYQTKVVDYHRRMVDQCKYLKNHYTNIIQAKARLCPENDQNMTGVLPQTSTSMVDMITASVQNNGLENISASQLKDTLSQSNMLRLNFEAPVSCGAQLNDPNMIDA
ncbi:unnamed protein product [Allacma fusca]|uniref:Uncharacterized protein n=1 Tax=Allacma fusca TaxID=39272 RepID=A0A8J2NRV6_9HEXA|nr:unnamed protein product [Allacma fusca]